MLHSYHTSLSTCFATVISVLPHEGPWLVDVVCTTAWWSPVLGVPSTTTTGHCLYACLSASMAAVLIAVALPVMSVFRSGRTDGLSGMKSNAFCQFRIKYQGLPVAPLFEGSPRGFAHRLAKSSVKGRSN